jgi:hypothetical protein
MATQYASGKYAIAECDRCGQRYKLKELKKEIVKTKLFQIKVCPECWSPDQPQLSLGMYPVYDPQAVREPRPDTSYVVSGPTGLRISNQSNNTVRSDGYSGDGSRQFQWGFNPVGGSSQSDAGLTPNDLTLNFIVSNVTISVT